MLTVPNDPDWLLVTVGSRVRAVGAGCGVGVVGAWTVTPFHVALMVTGVSCVTAFVAIEKDADSEPAGTVTEAGAVAAGLDLVTLTTAPPAGACPLSMTIAPVVGPPLVRNGNPSTEARDGGLTVNVVVVDVELIVAVSVTEVGAVTWPAVRKNSVHDVLPWTATDAGTGAAVAFELLRLIVPPDDGTADVSWRSTAVSWPLAGEGLVRVIEATFGAPEAIVNVPVVDHAVAALTVSLFIPWNDRTRQKWGPVVGRLMTVYAGRFSGGMSSSIVEKLELVENWSS